MKASLRATLSVLACAMTLLAPNAAHAALVAVATGSGTIQPGLSTVPTYQHVTFGGTATVVGDDAGTYDVSFDGNSIIMETLAQGEGIGTLSGGVSGTVHYVRAGNIVSLDGSGTVNGHAHTAIAAVCEFQGTDINPVQHYELACEGVFDPIP